MSSSPIALTLVVAVARNGVIGRDGCLPWRLSSDLKRFKAVTWGKPTLMGRKTWDSLPKKPLPGRQNLVLSRQVNKAAPGAWLYSSLDLALAAARAMAAASGVDEICVIGGAKLYEETAPFADRIVLTEVDLAPDGDAHFAPLGPEWREVSREEVEAGPNDDANFRVRVLERA
jgi:dihydrofolate reductase